MICITDSLRILLISILLFPTVLLSNELTHEEALERMKRIELLYRVPFSDRQYSLVASNPSALRTIGRPLTTEEEARRTSEQATGNYRSFKNALAHRESSGDPTAINQYGMIGMYQFSQEALADCNYSVDPAVFKRRPSIFPKQKQDEVFDTWIDILYSYMNDSIDQYDGRTVNTIKLDTSSILAGAHLIGAQGMKNWLKSNGRSNPRDGNGTTLTEYLKTFYGYSIPQSVSSN